MVFLFSLAFSFLYLPFLLSTKEVFIVFERPLFLIIPNRFFYADDDSGRNTYQLTFAIPLFVGLCVFKGSSITPGGSISTTGNRYPIFQKKTACAVNSVNCILESKDGSFWFVTHHKGVSLYDGKSFTNYTAEGVISGNEVWNIYEDKSGNIWFPAEGYEVYRYGARLSDGQGGFTNFHKKDGLASHVIQCIFEDKEGRLWFGGWLGLFRYDEKSLPIRQASFFSVTKNGPWQCVNKIQMLIPKKH